MTAHTTPIDELARSSLILAAEVLAGRTPWHEPVVLTLPEVAALLRVPEPVVRRLVVTGEIPGRLLEGEWRFLKSTVLSWLAGGNSRHAKTAGGWAEDARFPKEEWRSAPAVAAWDEVASREAEEFIEQVRNARQATVSDPSDEGDQ